jgi:hypothetical protein
VVTRFAFWLSWWAICWGLWMLLVFKTEPAEIVAGAIAAAVAATGAEVVRAHGYGFRPELRWWRGLVRLPLEVVRETWLLIVVLVRQYTRGEPIEGRFRIVHFHECAGQDPRKQARRAVAIWRASVSPNIYLLGFDEDSDVAVVHQLVPTETPPKLDPSA